MKKIFGFWNKLNKNTKLIVSISSTFALSSAIVFPILSTTIWNNDNLKPVDFKTCSWNDINVRCNKLESKKISEQQFYKLFTYDSNPITSIDDFVGKERTVLVNGQKHIVRVIDVKHDVDKNNTKLALTFEFYNSISDELGNCLAWQWNDTNERLTCSLDYINSSIRKVLCGNGRYESDIFCASKSSSTKWDDNYKNKTILSMLPDDLSKVLKTVKKTVGTTKSFIPTEYDDKLFCLSFLELGFDNVGDKGTGYPYYYYRDSIEETDSKRIKKQVNNSTKHTHSELIPEGSGHKYESFVYNNAGYNSELDGTGGCDYYTRSPSYASISENYLECIGCSDKGMKRDFVGTDYALAIAPAFCI